MDGKVCVVTGASSGTGRITALELAKAGAKVVMVCRNKTKAEPIRDAIVQEADNQAVSIVICDLGEMADVERAAGEIRAQCSKIDVLVNNAGAAVGPRRETSEGLEVNFAANYLGHFLLTNRLLDLLTTKDGGEGQGAAAAARIINVSSGAHAYVNIAFDDLQSKRWMGLSSYGQSKLAQIYFTRELADRLRGSGITVNSLHPGAVAAGFQYGMLGWRQSLAGLIYALFGISPEEGADTILYLATSPDVAGETAKYFYMRKAVPSSRASNDSTIGKRLWDESEKILQGLGIKLGPWAV